MKAWGEITNCARGGSFSWSCFTPSRKEAKLVFAFLDQLFQRFKVFTICIDERFSQSIDASAINILHFMCFIVFDQVVWAIPIPK